MPKATKKSLKVQAWHRWPDESELSYSLFRTYLEMGEERSLVKVEKESGRSYPLIASLSSKYKWSYRAREFDNYLLTIQEQTVEKSLRKQAVIFAQRRSIYREREYTLCDALLQQAEEMIQAPLWEQKVVEKTIVNGQEVPTLIIVKPAGWNKTTAGRYVKLAAEILRLNLEMDTQRITHVHTIDDGSARIQKARAALEYWTKNLDQLVDQEVQANPSLNREETASRILQQLPFWCAADHKIPNEEMHLLTEGLQIHPLSGQPYNQPVEDEALPMPDDEPDIITDSDLPM